MDALQDDDRFAALEDDGYRVLNSYNVPLSKLFYEWAGKNPLPPDALRTWKDAKRDLRVMDVSTFLRLLSHHGVIPTLLSSREAVAIYEQSAMVERQSKTRPDINGHVLDLQHFIAALFRMALHCFSGEWEHRYPTGEDKVRMLLFRLDSTHKMFKGNFQELARRQLDLPPTPNSWAEASREMGRLLSPASGNVDVVSVSPRAAGSAGPTSPAATSFAQTRLLRRMSASGAAAGTPRSRSTSPASSYRNSAYSPRIGDFQPVTQSSDPVLQHATATISSAGPGVLPSSATVPISPTKRPSKLSNVVDLPLPVSDIKQRHPPAVFSQIDLLDDSDGDGDDDGGPVRVQSPVDPYASRGRTLAMSGLQVDTAPMSRRSSSTPRSSSLPIPPQTVQTFLPPRMSHRGSFAVGQSLGADYGSSDALPSRRISKPVKLPDEPVANVHKHVASPFDYPKGAPQENALVLSAPSNAKAFLDDSSIGPSDDTSPPVIITAGMVRAACALDIGAAEDILRQLFARYCRYGDRMNMGSLAKLKSTQFAKFCKDAGVVRNATGTGHFKSVDSDIVFKCLVAQRVMNEQRGKEKHKEFEATRRVATNGLDEREMAVPGQPEASQWKHYSFLLRHTSTSMLNKALPFPDFVQALLLVGVKKYGDLQSYAHVREAALVVGADSTTQLVQPSPLPSATGGPSPAKTSFGKRETNALHRVIIEVSRAVSLSDSFLSAASESPSKLPVRSSGYESPQAAQPALTVDEETGLLSGCSGDPDEPVDRKRIPPAIALKLLLLVDVLPYAVSLGLLESVDSILLDQQSLMLMDHAVKTNIVDVASTAAATKSQRSGVDAASSAASVVHRDVVPDDADAATVTQSFDDDKPSHVPTLQPPPSGYLDVRNRSSPSLFDPAFPGLGQDTGTLGGGNKSSPQASELSQLRRRIELELDNLTIGGKFLSTMRSDDVEVQDSVAMPVQSFRYAQSLQAAMSPPEPAPAAFRSTSSAQSVASPSVSQLTQPPVDASVRSAATVSLDAYAPTLAMLAHSKVEGPPRDARLSGDVDRAAPPLVSASKAASSAQDNGQEYGPPSVSVTQSGKNGVTLQRRSRVSSAASTGSGSFVVPTPIPGPDATVADDLPFTTAGAAADVPTSARAGAAWPSFITQSTPVRVTRGDNSSVASGGEEEKQTPLPALSPGLWEAAIANGKRLSQGNGNVSAVTYTPKPADDVTMAVTPWTGGRGAAPPVAMGVSYMSSFDAGLSPPRTAQAASPPAPPTASTARGRSPTPRKPKPTHTADDIDDSGSHRSDEFGEYAQGPSSPPTLPVGGRAEGGHSPFDSRSPVAQPSLRAAGTAPASGQSPQRRPSAAAPWSLDASRYSYKARDDPHSSLLHNTIQGRRITGPAAVPFSSLPRFVEGSAGTDPKQHKREPLWPHQTLLRRYEFVDAAPKSYGNKGHAPTQSTSVSYARRATDVTAPATKASPSTAAESLINWPSLAAAPK